MTQLFHCLAQRVIVKCLLHARKEPWEVMGTEGGAWPWGWCGWWCLGRGSMWDAGRVHVMRLPCDLVWSG